ncbi:uncharacterized protein L969DRAFT_49628 [Mixia osmundae IAM 14324]|uniref:N-acetylglucosaminylphosphatidylinositol deacetylase n=1 Tax=Mixia osmundae (strain CBS 9802 / IAM 14324 / JCM 22182 / KY 12970) TaxID=764103 RepID=G7E0S9_MIXOS|nr:uncharacterized protein L969DRAFT_49628 [Mixia osmundae IAM 14324]KEI39470.1 hypothetical protein L969DRAFT_49628 [Mixia osmundae IAM 14324]GAA96439.1 hypothetical protein E5Q_03106 [Mixia osmundae IAM 14324]
MSSPRSASRAIVIQQQRPRLSKKIAWFAGLAGVLATLAQYAIYLLAFDRYDPAKGYISREVTSARRVLWVIAHPDDEAMFFGPSLNALLQPHRSVHHRRATGHLLSLSTGNHEGLGQLRTQELTASCEHFGIQRENCVALDHPQLQDSPTAVWPPAVVLEYVELYADRWNISLVITFDEHGVSGHANHRAIYAALERGRAHTGTSLPPIYKLATSTKASKYLSILSLPGAIRRGYTPPSEPYFTSALLLSDPRQYWRTRTAFARHASQQVWFRSLYVVLSQARNADEKVGLSIQTRDVTSSLQERHSHGVWAWLTRHFRFASPGDAMHQAMWILTTTKHSATQT